MVKLGTVAAGSGVLAGGASILSGFEMSYALVPANTLLPPAYLVIGSSIVLILLSLVCFLGFRLAFFGLAAISVINASALLLAWWWAPSATGGILFWGAEVLSLVTAAVGLLAGRSTYKLPAGSHPMDMPVFG